MTRLLFLLIAGLVSIRTLYVEPAFHQLPPEKLGLKSVSGICWRNDGTAWMSSEQGLVHYNGYATQIFKHDKNDSNSIRSNVVRGTLVDSKNQLWIFYRDQGGFSIFNPDENKFTHFRPDSTKTNTIPDALLTGFREDSKGRIWITTWGRGLVQFFPKTKTFKTYPLKPFSDNPKDCPASRIKAMVEMADGKFLIGFFETSKYDEAYPHIFDPEKETFTPYPLDEAINKCSPALADAIRTGLKIVNFIHIDNQGNSWFGTYSGLIFYDKSKNEIKRVSGKNTNGNVFNLENTRGYVVDEKGLLWISTFNSGIMIVDPKTCEATYSTFNPKVPSSLADNGIAHIKKDPYGNIWTLTGTGGFSIYSPVSQQFSLLSWESMGLEFSDASSDDVKANQLLVRSHRELMASSKTGITIFDPLSRQITGHVNLTSIEKHRNPNEKVSSVEDFKIWNDTIALTFVKDPYYSTGKVENFNPAKAKKEDACHLHFRHEPRVKRALYSLELDDKEAHVLYELDFKQQALVPFVSLPVGTKLSHRYSFLLNDGRWLISCGATEFVVIDPATKAYEIYGPKHPDHFFPDSTINACHIDAKNQLWFCTAHGLYKYDLKTKKHEKVNQQIGIGDQEVVAMITDRQGIRWIAFPNAIVRWDEQRNQVFRFDRELGLMSIKLIPSFPQMDDLGVIYMATANGVLIFNPANIQLPNTEPTINISSIVINSDTLNKDDREAFVAGNKNIAYDDNEVSIDLYSNQIFTPLPNRFYYRFLKDDSVGMSVRWEDNATSNRIRLSNLSAGTYHLQVKLRNLYGIESKAMNIHFVVEKPFWLRTWFILLCLILVAFLIYLYIKKRERSLKEQQLRLEQKIADRTSEVVEKANEIHRQKDIIEEKNKELTDSINYAQRIQVAILPDEKELRQHFPHHFVLFQPKDIVSGDFYWSSQQNDSVLWAVVDSTGHGVPGGFMSMLGAGLLNQIVNEEHKLQPDIILNELRTRVIHALKQTGADGENRDGMDMSLCRFLPSKKKLQFAGAFNGVYLVRNGELQDLQGNKQPIGIYIGEQKPFTMQEIDVMPGDQFYITSDGFTDQFGGPRGKKFKSSNFEKMLLAMYSLPMNEQKVHVEKTFNDWKGTLEQLDDVCVFGVRINLDE